MPIPNRRPQSLISNQDMAQFASNIPSAPSGLPPVQSGRRADYPYPGQYPRPGIDYDPAGVPEPTWGNVIDNWVDDTLFGWNKPRFPRSRNRG